MSEFRTDRLASITYDCDPGPEGHIKGRSRGHAYCHGRQCACICHTAGVHMYAVQGTRVTTHYGPRLGHGADTVGALVHGSRQLPTIYLHPDVQGIVSEEHAERIARSMFEDVAGPDTVVNVYAHLVTIEPHTDARHPQEANARAYPWLAPGFIPHNKR